MNKHSFIILSLLELCQFDNIQANISNESNSLHKNESFTYRK